MKRLMKQYPLLLMLFISILLSGCVPLIVGGAAAVGGYAISPDTVEGTTQHSELAVWDSAVKVVSLMGAIQQQVETGGVIVATVNGAKVTVTILPVDKTSVKLNVKARKSILPKIAIAQDVYAKIIDNIKE